MIDLRMLRSTVLVAEHKSFRKAAAAIRAGQSGLSRQIRCLEDAIGVSIFERHSGGVNLTLAGAEFITAIQRALAEIDYAISIAGRAGTGEIGRLTIGFYTSLSGGELRKVLFEYLGQFPGVAIQTIEADATGLLAALRSNCIDMAVITEWSAVQLGAMDRLDLWRERVVVALPEAHELCSRNVVQWHELNNSQCLLTRRDPGPELADQINVRSRSRSNLPIIVRHDVCSESLTSLVAAGGGVTVLYESSIGRPQLGVVYRTLQDESGPSYIGYLATWNPNNDNPALRRLLSLLRECYGRRDSLTALAGRG